MASRSLHLRSAGTIHRWRQSGGWPRAGRSHHQPVGIDDLHRTAGAKGFVSTGDVRDAGVAPRTFQRHARQVAWEPRYRSIWVPPGALDAHRQIEAAVAASSGEVLATGRTALFLAGVVGDPPQNVELLVPAHRRLAAKEGICLHRTTVYEQVRYQHRSGVRTAAFPRAFADAAAHAHVNSLETSQQRCAFGAAPSPVSVGNWRFGDASPAAADSGKPTVCLRARWCIRLGNAWDGGCYGRRACAPTPRR